MVALSAVAVLSYTLIQILYNTGYVLAAQLSRTTISHFSVGVGPSLIRRQFGETVYSLNALPFGGFVKVENAPAGFWRPVFFSSGPFACLIFACIAGWCYLTAGYGAVSPTGAVVQSVDRSHAGGQLLAGDVILSAGGQQVRSALDLAVYLHHDTSQFVAFGVSRKGCSTRVTVGRAEPKRRGGTGRLGSKFCSRVEFTRQRPVAAALHAPGLLLRFAYYAAGTLLARSSRVGAGSLRQRTASGLTLSVCITVLLALALFSAVFNMIPLPLLVGWQVALASVEAVLGHTLSDGARRRVEVVGWLLVLALFVACLVWQIVPGDAFFPGATGLLQRAALNTFWSA